jgi:hypothetical protein
MMDYLAALNALAPKFQVSPLPGGSKLEPGLRIDPPPEALDGEGLALSETVQKITAVEVPITIDLAFLGKWVRSVNSDLPAEPATEDPIGGMPVVEQILLLGGALSQNLPPGSLMQSDPNQQAVPGVPEVLGRIKGTVAQTVEKLAEVVERHAVTVAVRWRVFDESMPGTSLPASGVQFRSDPNAAWASLPSLLELPQGGIPAANTPMSIFLRFPMMFSELTTGTPDVMIFSVRSAVRLSLTPPAGPVVTTGWVDLPPVPLVVPTIPVPTILVLCEHRDFAGRKLVLVPSNSLIGTASGIGIGTAINITSSVLQSLLPSNTLLTVFLAAASGTPVGDAANALRALAASPGQTIIGAQSRVDNLDTPAFVFDPGGAFGVGRLTGDNMVSSVICIGRPQTVFDMFHDANLSERITRFQISLDGSLGCAIRKLDTTAPAGDVVYGASVTSSSPVWSNEDRITSLAFTGPAARFQPV